MEPYFNSIEEEQEYFARRAKRKQRMIRERKRRQRCRRIIKLCACLSVLCILFVACAGIFGKKGKENKTKAQTQTNQNVIAKENEPFADPADELVALAVVIAIDCVTEASSAAASSASNH